MVIRHCDKQKHSIPIPTKINLTTISNSDPKGRCGDVLPINHVVLVLRSVGIMSLSQVLTVT